MPMYFNPAIPFTDLIRLTIIFMLLFYVRKIETIHCKIGPSWKPTYIKFYAIISIVFIIISLFYGPTFEMTSFQVSLNGMLTAILIWAIFSYVREIEDAFRECHVGKLDMDFHLVHEFLKLYSLIMVLLIIVFILFVVSIYMTFIPVPKYIGTQQIINNTINNTLNNTLKHIGKPSARDMLALQRKNSMKSIRKSIGKSVRKSIGKK